MVEHARQFPVKRMCEVLKVSSSGYYDWRQRPPGQRQQANEQLLAAIRREHEASRRTYGSPRIQAALKRQRIQASKNRIARLMRENGIVARLLSVNSRSPRSELTRRWWHPICWPRISRPARPTKSGWPTSPTSILSKAGCIWPRSWICLPGASWVGPWLTNMRAELVENALLMALGRRLPGPGLLHHSDQGGQFTSWLIQSLLAAHHIQVSMSDAGNCFDNAPMESFIGTLKTECVTYQFATRAQARSIIFEYIEVWYNNHRLHSSLDYMPPAEFEHQYFYPLESVR